MTVPYIFANATGAVALVELDANFANVSAHVDTAGTVTANAQANITSVGVLTSLNVAGNVVGGQFVGNGNTISNIQGANVSGTVTSASYSINSIQANYANVANSVSGGNVSGQVNNALIAGTVYTNAQPNITSVGTLTSLSSSGNIWGVNLVTSGQVSAIANIIGGNVNATNNLTGTNVSVTGTTTSASTVGGVIIGASVSVTGTTTSASTVGGVITGASVSVTGNVTGGNLLTSGLVSATGNVTGGNLLTSGLVSATGSLNTNGVIVAQGNIRGANLISNGLITATGTITGGNVVSSGSVSAIGNIIGNNLTVGSGNVNVGNVIFSNSSKFNSAAWTLVESFSNLVPGSGGIMHANMTNTIGFYVGNYNELIVTYNGSPGDGQLQITLPTPAISVPGTFVLSVAPGAAGAPYTIGWSNINSGNTTIHSGTGGESSVNINIYAR